MSNFFAYGTLQVAEIIRAVTGRTFAGVPAILPGYGCYFLKGLPYPGICAEPQHQTSGLLYSGLDEETLVRLDGFEDSCYQRQLLQVRTAGAERVPAFAYVIPAARREVLDSRPWDLAGFLAGHRTSFLAGVAEQRDSSGAGEGLRFDELPDGRGRVYVPVRSGVAPRHGCPDCHACQQCSGERCRLCRSVGK